MKKRILAFGAALIISAGAAYASSDTGYIFKYHMHQLFDNFNHAQLSMSLRKYDVADIYLKHIQEEIKGLKESAPEALKDGARIDKERFLKRLSDLSGAVTEVRGAIAKGGQKEAKQLTQKVFNACVGCHEEARLEALFKVSRVPDPFADYMHKVRQHMDIAKIHIEEKGSPAEIEDNLKLINYYLDLLKINFPVSGPSGIIMDKESFSKRLAEVRSEGAEMLNAASLKKTVDIESFREKLNGLCVACHEPERLK